MLRSNFVTVLDRRTILEGDSDRKGRLFMGIAGGLELEMEKISNF